MQGAAIGSVLECSALPKDTLTEWNVATNLLVIGQPALPPVPQLHLITAVRHWQEKNRPGTGSILKMI